jgi:hypothetical protein
VRTFGKWGRAAKKGLNGKAKATNAKTASTPGDSPAAAPKKRPAKGGEAGAPIRLAAKGAKASADKKAPAKSASTAKPKPKAKAKKSAVSKRP